MSHKIVVHSVPQGLASLWRPLRSGSHATHPQKGWRGPWTLTLHTSWGNVQLWGVRECKGGVPSFPTPADWVLGHRSWAKTAWALQCARIWCWAWFLSLLLLFLHVKMQSLWSVIPHACYWRLLGSEKIVLWNLYQLEQIIISILLGGPFGNEPGFISLYFSIFILVCFEDPFAYYGFLSSWWFCKSPCFILIYIFLRCFPPLVCFCCRHWLKLIPLQILWLMTFWGTWIVWLELLSWVTMNTFDLAQEWSLSATSVSSSSSDWLIFFLDLLFLGQYVGWLLDNILQCGRYCCVHCSHLQQDADLFFHAHQLCLCWLCLFWNSGFCILYILEHSYHNAFFSSGIYFGPLLLGYIYLGLGSKYS